jgi:hypothetical protein
MSMSEIKALLDSLQRQMDEIAAGIPAPPRHPVVNGSSTADSAGLWSEREQYRFIDRRLDLLRQIEALDAEHARESALHAAWLGDLAAHKAAVEQQEAAWASTVAQYEAVSTTAALLAKRLPMPAPAPEVVPTAPAVETAADEDADDAMDTSLSFTEQVLSVFTRNAASSKQWAVREVAQAVAKSNGLGNNVPPKLLKAVDNALRRLLRQGQVKSKKSDARGAVVYSIH